MFSLTVRTGFHVAPPSVVLYTPRSPPGENSGPCAATNTVFEFRGSITIFATCSEFGRPDFLPRVPCVRALIDAVAIPDRALRLVFARTQPDHVRILRVHHDYAERVRPFIVEHRLKVKPAIGGLPQPARRRRDVPRAAILGIDRDIRDPPGSKNAADIADFKSLDEIGGYAARTTENSGQAT